MNDFRVAVARMPKSKARFSAIELDCYGVDRRGLPVVSGFDTELRFFGCNWGVSTTKAEYVATFVRLAL